MTFIGVPDPGDGTPEKQEEFMSRMNPRVSHVLDEPLELWREFDVATQPTMVFVAGDGSRTVHTGGIEAGELLDRVSELSLT